MAFVKRRLKSTETPNIDRRRSERNFDTLLIQLEDEDANVRRWAARDLGEFSEAVEPLCCRLGVEQDFAVCEAILESARRIGGKSVIHNLIPFLRSENAALRNGVVEVLQKMPEDLDPYMETLLTDPDSDVRILAVGILLDLAHPKTPEWLLRVAQHDDHVNVVGTAIDHLAEVGTPDFVPALVEIKERFAGESYLCFAVDAVIRRIGGEQ